MKADGCVFLFLIITAQSFVLKMTEPKIQCFRTEQNLDKTLKLKFNLARPAEKGCQVTLLVTSNTMHENISRVLWKENYLCANFKEDVVFKHGSKITDTDAYYNICVELIENYNEELFFELELGEIYDPELFEEMDSQEKLPFIAASELWEINMVVHEMKTSLERGKKLAIDFQREDVKLNKQLDELYDINRVATILQILFLIAFGIVWLVLLAYKSKL